jgi:hypothetical protein
MKRTALVVFSLCLLIVATALIAIPKPIIGKSIASRDQGARAPQAANPRIVESYGKLPLSFEANEGQTGSQVKFISRGNGYSLFLTSTEAVLSLQGPPTRKEPQVSQISSRTLPSSSPAKSGAVLKMKLVGANASPQLTGRDELPGKSNYLIGNNPAKWRTNLPNYAKVTYADVYPGIDLVYYGHQGKLEYDFVVSPGANPGAIRVSINGDEKRRIDRQGDLVLEAAGSEFRLHRPIIYQEINGTRQRIAGNFAIHGTRQVGFEVARYDSSKPLIIDPVLSYSTYLGGPGYNYGSAIALDPSGNAYITGITRSIDFPTTANAFQAGAGSFADDVFVTKFNAAGSALVYSTYLVHQAFNGANDFPPAIAVDSSGDAYVTGSTGSTNFATANAFQQTNAGGWADVFVTKLNAAGSALVYSTYLGGFGFDYGTGIAVDSSGNAYVTGVTFSTNFPTVNAFQAEIGGNPYLYERNAFVTKLNTDGSALIYSTYLGGGGYTDGYGIAVDTSGNAYVTGMAISPNFPTTAGAFQTTGGGCFVTKFTFAGTALAYSTRINSPWCSAIAVDSSGNAYVTGSTFATDFPTANAFQVTNAGGGDAFVTKLNAAGTALVYSTYLGGSGKDGGQGIAVDSSGNAYVTGWIASTDFPTANAFQAMYGGGDTDAFVTELNAEGSALIYSTFLGGKGGEGTVFCDCPVGLGIAVDTSGNAYLTGWTTSTDFPTSNAFQAAFGGIFVTKFPVVADPWQEAITAMKTAAETDSLNFWQWSWFWQRSTAFPGAPAGFGLLGSIDNAPGMIDKIIAVGGGDGFRIVSAEQWVLYYRQAAPPSVPHRAAAASDSARAVSPSPSPNEEMHRAM